MTSNNCVRLCLSFFLFAFVSTAFADQSYYILDPATSGARLQDGISSPAEFLGFEIGERTIRHAETNAYFQYLGDRSDRAVFARYGATPAGRALFKLVISDPENLTNLAEIQRRLERIGDNASGISELIEDTPAVAWMGYGIHGNELASSDAAVMLAYRLVAGEDEEIRRIRQQLVVHVDPMYNPDGRARATAHVDEFRRAMSSNDPQDIVHNEFWANGRGNHYFFDLNRDAAFQVQTQSRQRVRAIRDANPQLYVASHETEWYDTYLFAVPAEPLNPFLSKEVHQSWADFSKDHSAAFDELGLNYYTRAWNEVFYMGYYDILPAYFGAVPILYEQAATSGLSVTIPTEQIRTFHQAVANHFRSSMANLVTASANKDTLLRRWATARQAARNDNSRARAWIVVPNDDYKTRETLRIATSLGVEVEVLGEPTTARGLHSYWGGEPQQRSLPAGTLKIDVGQTMAGIVHNLFDYHVPMSAEFVAEEKQNLDLGHDTQIYDVTAWSLPLAFNAAIYWTDTLPSGDWRAVNDAEQAGGRELAAPANYGYLYIDDSLHATMRLLHRGFKIRVGNEPFVHEGIRYPRGTFLVRAGEQPSDALDALNTETRAGEIHLVPVESARITEGGPDLGGDDFTLLKQPKIAIIGGEGVSLTNFGAIWHLLDETIRMPVTLLNIDDLDSVDLRNYSVLILPEADDEDESVAAQVTTGAMQRWVQGGGTLVTLGSASLLLAKSDLSTMMARQDALDSYPPLMIGRSARELMANDFLGLMDRQTPPPKRLPPVLGDAARQFTDSGFPAFDVTQTASSFAEWTDGLELPGDALTGLVSQMTKYLPHGAYLRVDLKPKHWLAYGVGNKVPALFRDDDVLLPGTGTELIGRYSGPGDLMLSGLVWPEAVGYIAGTAYLADEQRGRGHIIAFANDPVFRGYSLGTARLFLNAVTFGTAY